jgi:hypothetical protein|nr:MAG TPA: Tryptophanase operon leader peptide [Caudoviricetes sp.]
MICGILYGLLCGRILSWFNVDNICIKALQPFISFELTTAHYYFVFGLVGMIYGIIHN